MSLLKTVATFLILLGVIVIGYGLVLNDNISPYCEDGVITPAITPTPMVTSIRTPTRIRTTSPHPPVYSVTTYPATDITATSAVLHATLTLIDPGLGIKRDDYFYWNGYSADKTWSFESHSMNFVYGGQYSQTLTGLTPNTTYYFRAYAYGVYAQYRSFTTLPVDVTPTPTPVIEPTPAPTPVRTCAHNPETGHHHLIISGCVYDGHTGQGIAKAKVSILHVSMDTDKKGRYRIHLKNVKPESGPWTFMVQATGYITQTTSVNSIPGKVTQDFYLIPQTVPTPTPTPVRTVTPYHTTTPRRSAVLTVSVSPDGYGSVYVNPPGVWTSSTVKLDYPYGTEVTLSASLMSYPHYLFGTWEGAVNVRQTSITIIMNGNKSVTAKYYWSLPPEQPSPTPVSTIKATPVGAPTPTPTVTPLDTHMIKVQFYNQNTAATSNLIYLNFRLVNISTDAIALSDVKMRYYYTKDGTQLQNFYTDYAQVGSVNVSGIFASVDPPKIGVDTYLEVGFKSGAGSLAAGSGTVIQSRVAKSDWSDYNQTNDYSFNPSATTYFDWPKVAGYVSGVLQWGVEP